MFPVNGFHMIKTFHDSSGYEHIMWQRLLVGSAGVGTGPDESKVY
jgi:hypothetical protein